MSEDRSEAFNRVVTWKHIECFVGEVEFSFSDEIEDIEQGGVPEPGVDAFGPFHVYECSYQAMNADVGRVVGMKPRGEIAP